MTSPVGLPANNAHKNPPARPQKQGKLQYERMASGLISNREGRKELTIAAALWFYLSYYDSKTHRRILSCWLAFGPAIYARYIHHRLPSPPVVLSRSVPRAAREPDRPSRRSLLSTAFLFRSYRKRSSVCWDRTARASRRRLESSPPACGPRAARLGLASMMSGRIRSRSNG